MAPGAASARDVLVVALAKAAVSAIVLATGFRAVSDDDFARVVIAQRLVAQPSLDPTGTSWLPLPFWLQGGVMALFGRSIEVARSTAFVLGIAAALCIWLGARWAGAPRRAATLGAVVASSIPYAAWLGVATVPDFPAAALIVLGIGAAGSDAASRRSMGALALSAAALSRYEAWPVAIGFALLCAVDAIRSRNRALALPALLAVLGPVIWLTHGMLAHGDALFFVARVSAYKRAVGAAVPFYDALIGQPLAVLRCEPELAATALIALATSIATRRTEALRRHARPLALLGLLLLFLVLGELRASGATHHAERAVLAIWLWLAVLAADLANDVWPALRPRAQTALVATTFATVALSALVLRPWYARRDSFIDRGPEVAIGRRAAELASPGDLLAVDTPDFGFYAVIAGFAAPERARALDDRDPRRPPRPDPFASEQALRVELGSARWLVVSTEHVPVAGRVAAVRHRDGRFALLEASH